ncbi:DUF6317 family protein [Williamsia maris]|uniref:Excreted virulence factor EspC (Type VII ESX diderm) n=1 Tax=Williamsia maris TaxID=72806 RepID=A0ABT1H929_9NOCA|nr:DUF6317 family protein [Williamsia maris]MCP2174762.1 hypothetical protein [Williamsia maris]
MADFSVVLNDLASLSTRFSNSARSYETAASKLNPPAAASGDAGCDSAIHAVMDMLTILNSSMTASIDDHAAKLKDARDEYDRTEDINKNRFLWDNLNEDFK